MDYFIQLLKMLFVLLLLGAGSYFAVKYMKKKQTSQVSENRMMQVIDGMQVNMNQSVYLMKVGEEYVLLSTGNSGVGMMSLNQKQIDDPKEKWDEAFGEENSVSMMKSLTKMTKEKLKKE